MGQPPLSNLINEPVNQGVKMNQVSYPELDQPSNDHTAAATEAPQRIASSELLRGQRKLIIEHGESTYVLLLTRNGKLILNK